MSNPLIHPQALQNQHLRFVLDSHPLGKLLCRHIPQHPPSTRKPEQNQVELPARQQLHRDVEEARIARTQRQRIMREAVRGDVGQSGREDRGLRVGVFVGGCWVMFRVVCSVLALEGVAERLLSWYSLALLELILLLIPLLVLLLVLTLKG